MFRTRTVGRRPTSICEEIVIAKNGVPQARLLPLASRGERRKPANAMRIRRTAADFDAPDPAIEALFGGEDA